MNTAAGAESAKLTCVSSNSASPCLGAINQNPWTLVLVLITKKTHIIQEDACNNYLIVLHCFGERTYKNHALSGVNEACTTIISRRRPVPPTHVALVAVLLLRFEAAAMGSPARNLKGIIFKNA